MSQQKSALRRNGFTFKQFFVAHDRCAMKVGTDGVLLGCWAPVAGVTRVLDIGTGSGLLALMLAQRTGGLATIDAVELDTDAAQQAAENVQASPWAGQITVHQADIISWTTQCSQRYQLIVSNPPYFTPGNDSSSRARDTARSTTHLTHDALLSCAEALIAEEGYFAVVLPENLGSELVSRAVARGWHLRLRTDIADRENRLPVRVLLAFSPRPGEIFSDRLVIRDSDNQYSEAYCSLARDFYLYR